MPGAILTPLELKEKTIKQLLNRTSLTLRNILYENWPKELESQIHREIFALASHKKIKWSDISKCWHSIYEEEKRSTFKLHFFYAKLYHSCARNSYNEGRIEESWLYLSQSMKWIGFLEGYKQQKKEIDFRASRASKGGKELELKKSQIKEKIHALLDALPDKSLKSKLSAADEIASNKDLAELISSIGAEGTVKNLKEFVISEITSTPQKRDTAPKK